MGRHGSRIPRGGARRAGRNSRDRVTDAQVLPGHALPAAIVIYRKKATSDRAGVCASRGRLGQEKAGRQRIEIMQTSLYARMRRQDAAATTGETPALLSPIVTKGPARGGFLASHHSYLEPWSAFL